MPPQALTPFSGIVTLFTADVCGFGGILKGMDPDTLTQLMIAWFAGGQKTPGVKQCIQEGGGHIVRSIGDSVLAYWGPAQEAPDHAAQALACGRRILMLQKQSASETKLSCRTQIFLATGKMNGSLMQGRFQLVGDPNIVIKRLEEIGPVNQSRMLFTSETLAPAASSQESPTPIARIKGVSGQEVPVFEFIA